MDGNEKFFAILWALAAFVVVTGFGIIGGTMAYKTSVLARMVAESKADPMRAACALDIGERKDGICAILAAH